jgi:hypothetical protein
MNDRLDPRDDYNSWEEGNGWWKALGCFLMALSAALVITVGIYLVGFIRDAQALSPLPPAASETQVFPTEIAAEQYWQATGCPEWDGYYWRYYC